jgi:ligand-binding SRPBCC domain-containing protein/tRNA A-37 threonylcarbamoyl transferase component Bud32
VAGRRPIGRASTITNLGDGRLRRDGGAPVREARLMEHARAHGYPTPTVLELHDEYMVLEHVDGPTMAEDLQLRPWRLASHARMLADLHTRLHEIEHPDGGTLVHRDLHPANVLLSPRGPVVIDWTNASSGDPAMDDALTWVILMTSAGAMGRAFARLFSRRLDVRTGLEAAVAYRLADPNVTDAERGRVQALLPAVLEREQVVAAPLEDAFAFFADPWNLQAITPAWLHFRIVEAPDTLREGAVLRYRLRLFGVPIAWRTEIARWTPPHGFVDVQTNGPYRLWEHTHELESLDPARTRIRDRVRYRVPFERAARPLVRRWLDEIFDFRERAIREDLG